MSCLYQYPYGDDAVSIRCRYQELLSEFLDQVPDKVGPVRIPSQPTSKPATARAMELGDKRPTNGQNVNVDVQEGPSTLSARPVTVSSDFDRAWLRLPATLTSQPHYVVMQDIVRRCCKDESAFKSSLPVLKNGIDYCYFGRPMFGDLLHDLDEQTYTIKDLDAIQTEGLMPPRASILEFTEALWRAQSGSTRSARWFHVAATSMDGIHGFFSLPLVLKETEYKRMNLSRWAEDPGSERCHFAIAGALQMPEPVGPAHGKLLVVVEGEVVLITWPPTPHNLDCWWATINDATPASWKTLCDFQRPSVNYLRAGDAIHLPVGSFHGMIAMTNACLTSRPLLNPTRRDVETMGRVCLFFLNRYINEHKKGYSPYDDLEVINIRNQLSLWCGFASEVPFGDRPSTRTLKPKHVLSCDGPNCLLLMRQLTEILKKIDTYNKLADQAIVDCQGKTCKGTACGSVCGHSRPYAVFSKLASLADRGELSGEGGESCHMRNGNSSGGLSIKGKQRAAI